MSFIPFFKSSAQNASLTENSIMRITIIIPVLNDGPELQQLLPQLLSQPTSSNAQIIVVDGGSSDSPELICETFGVTCVPSEPGRATQMNTGAGAATGNILLFLHADSQLPDGFENLIKDAMSQSLWGRFDVRLSGSQSMFRIIEWMMNHRSRLTGICTGDQGIFVQSELFFKQGGFPDIPIMEDIALSKALPGAPYCIRQKLITSSRRWEQNGIWKTILLMWSLRLRYFFGATPVQLVKQYYG
tara:strand:- start:35415 stop:36146 length:732 start_codon:yes stop_codon:yes gene_type:complete